MKKHPKLETLIDKSFVDSMENEFNDLTGSWPESYYFTNAQGICTWHTTIEMQGPEPINNALAYAQSNGLVENGAMKNGKK